MGGEFAQVREWNYQQSLDWHLLKNKKHEGIRKLVCDLNHLYRNTAALYETDCEQGGFEWIDPDDTDRSIYSFIRYAKNGEGMVVVSNFTPVPRQGYTLGLPRGGVLREVLNTDAHLYGGSGVHNTEPLESCVQQHGRFEHQVNVNVPPLATIFFTWDSPE